MPKIKLEDVGVGSRFRKKFEAVEELASSIANFGLLHPIIVDEDNNLIAGERRYRAHLLLLKQTKDETKWGEIEVKHKKDLNKLEKKEIELEENIQRKAFTWQEEVAAKAQLHKLKQALHGSAVKGHDSSGWKLKDTAQALGESVGNVSMDVQLARGIKAFPELAKEKSKSSAYKRMKQLQDRMLQDELAKRLQKRGVIDRPDFINGNCIEEMAKLDSDSIDLIVTDPPYGIDLSKAHTYGRMNHTDVNFIDSDFETFDLLDKAFAQMFRLLKMNRHMYVFCGIDKVSTVIKLLIKHGFEVHRLPLIWDKGSGSYPSQSTSYVHSYESFLHVMKGKRKLNGTPKDIFTVKRVPPTRKIHPTEKPTELLRDLINLSSIPGERVLDPFAGSGATIVAAKETNRQGIGIEMDTAMFDKVCKRLGDTNDSPRNGE